MMTGAAGVVMWLMMGVMMLAMAGGLVVWAKRRLPRQARTTRSQTPGNSTPDQ